MHAKLSWFPVPRFEYRQWLIGLILANLVLLAYFFAAIMLLNGMSHTFFTVLGRMASVQFARPAPGLYSSPFLLITSIYLFMRLRASRETTAE
jgi:hypothetical protein